MMPMLEDAGNTRLNRRTLRKWLNSKEPDGVVGVTTRYQECPLATFITETRDVSWVRVLSFADMRMKDGRLLTANTRWIQPFVRGVDALYRQPDGFYQMNKPVTAAQALQVLDEVEADFNA
jgi:hypothetical protein